GSRARRAPCARAPCCARAGRTTMRAARQAESGIPAAAWSAGARPESGGLRFPAVPACERRVRSYEISEPHAADRSRATAKSRVSRSLRPLLRSGVQIRDQLAFQTCDLVLEQQLALLHAP